MIFLGFITGKETDSITVSKGGNIVVIEKETYANPDLYQAVEDIIVSAESSNFKMSNFKNSNDIILEVTMKTTNPNLVMGDCKEYDFSSFQQNVKDTLVGFFDTIDGLNG